MQDIPRNELLDKLAAGWKVRRKDWEDGVTIVKHGGNASCHWVEMLKGDWEGEPPEPVLRDRDVNIIRAFAELRNGQKFIQRGDGINKVRVNNNHTSVALTPKDILADDWEVWA